MEVSSKLLLTARSE